MAENMYKLSLMAEIGSVLIGLYKKTCETDQNNIFKQGFVQIGKIKFRREHK